MPTGTGRRLHITHRTGYRYADVVDASFNEVRMTPLSVDGQLLLNHTLSVHPASSVQTYQDYWGAHVEAFDVHQPHRVLEIVSIMIRPLTLTLRLYGNVYAGENLLELMLQMGGQWFGWLAALPFYFLELLVGLIQALVFTLLTAVFTSLMCHHEEEGEHGHARDEPAGAPGD